MKHLILTFGVFISGATFQDYLQNHAHIHWYLSGWTYNFPNPEMKNNDTVHEWAKSVLDKHFKDAKDGSYDACFSHGIKTQTKDFGEISIGLDQTDYPDDVINACAIVLAGAEW